MRAHTGFQWADWGGLEGARSWAVSSGCLTSLGWNTVDKRALGLLSGTAGASKSVPLRSPPRPISESDPQVMGQWLLLVPSQHALLCAWSCERCALPLPGPDILHFSLGRSKLCKIRGIFCGFWGGPSEAERIALGDTMELGG